MNKNIVIAVVVVAVLALGGWWLYSSNNTPAPANQQTQQTEQENPIVDITVTPVAMTHEVIYSDSGYAPATLTVKAGDTVNFKNQSTGNVWTGSAMHPTHIVYGGTALAQHCPDVENDDFDQCKNEGPGTSWSFTFTKTGTWGYHNHAKANHFGKVVVE